MSEPFGFTVGKTDDEDDNPADLWRVSLPHQCDRWLVAAASPYTGLPHDQAIATLTRFIAEAQSALAALVERREVSA